MGLPTLESGPFVFNVNNLITGSDLTDKFKKTWLAYKDELVALGGAGTIWTVVASSDSSSVKNTDDSSPWDLWSDTTDIVNGTGAHSWCVLENSTTGSQLAIQLNYSNLYSGRIWYSPAGTFSDDGTTSALPTHTDGLEVCSGSHFSNSTDCLKVVLNIMTSADHKTLRIYPHERRSTDGIVGGKITLIEEAVNTPALWSSTNKTVCLKNDFAFSVSSMSTSSFDQPPEAHEHDGAVWNTRVVTTAPFNDWVAMHPTCECYGDLATAGAATPIWQYNGDCGLNGGFPISPIGIYNPTAGVHGGSWGRLRDIYLGQRLHHTLDTYPADVSRTWVKWGAFIVPWNGTAPLDAV